MDAERYRVLPFRLPTERRRVLLIEILGPTLRFYRIRQRFRRIVVEAARQISVPEGEALAEEEFFQAVQEMGGRTSGAEVALVFPQDRCISSVIDVPEDLELPVREFLLTEARRVIGLPSASIYLRYRPLEPFGTYKNPYWVTFCRAEELEGWLERLGLADPDTAEAVLAELVSTGEMLFAWARRMRHQFGQESQDGVWVYWDGRMTHVAITYQGQGVFATALSDKPPSLSSQTAKNLQSQNTKTNPDSSSNDLWQSRCRHWADALHRVVQEWGREALGPGFHWTDFPLYLSGSGLDHPAFQQTFQQMFETQIYIDPLHGTSSTPSSSVELWGPQLGLAGEVLGRGFRGLSLLPTAWEERTRSLRWLRIACYTVQTLLVLLALLLGWRFYGASQQLHQLRTLNQQLLSALGSIQKASRMEKEYQNLVQQLSPILEAAADHQSILTAWAAWRGIRLHPTNEWLTLLADAKSYLTGSVLDLQQQKNTNWMVQLQSVPGGARSQIAEVCLVWNGSKLAQRLRALVDQLNRSQGMAVVDLLPPDLEQHRSSTNIALPKSLHTLVLVSHTALEHFTGPKEEVASTSSTKKVRQRIPSLLHFGAPRSVDP